MKSKYFNPTVSVEELEKVDVLLESEDNGQLSELENRYGNFASFAIKEITDWFKE